MLEINYASSKTDVNAREKGEICEEQMNRKLIFGAKNKYKVTGPDPDTPSRISRAVLPSEVPLYNP